ncbi:hypothetical protein BO86DRAFT_116710 [Aspergillus japonicus CBS 114.51]|uniref:Uncharacterized protein n=1 Tax=Aspergillus japonicus CBS 114.51 TaxID=1448312 RepID=A0A8T8XED2_ASPJA|nr:hypothetical protein BO86DRAFT_116710 [Aspergillus japonicus CBS 114.51]RAH86677.1 hypothetical protein BO86DRAFT_116710 [Aspergillus japonicus CBS 114.51]
MKLKRILELREEMQASGSLSEMLVCSLHVMSCCLPSADAADHWQVLRYLCLTLLSGRLDFDGTAHFSSSHILQAEMIYCAYDARSRGNRSSRWHG